MRFFLSLAASLALAASIAAPSTWADEAPPGLDASAVRAAVIASSASVRKAELAHASALLASQAQANKLLPSISASVGASLDYLSSDPLGKGLGASGRLAVSQTIYDGGRQAALTQSADVSARASLAAVSAARVAAVSLADGAFYAALRAQATVEAATADLEAARLRLGIAEAKAESGAIALSEYLSAQAELASREAALSKARLALSSARSRLGSLSGLPSATALRPVDFGRYAELSERLAALDAGGVEALASRLKAVASEANPSLQGYALAAQKATIAEDAARRAWAPTLSAGLSQGLGWNAADGLSLGGGSLSLTGAISLDPWTTANGVAAASLSARAAALDAAEGARSIGLDIEVALNGLVASAGSIPAQTKALEYAEIAYRATLERYALSAASASELASAEAVVSAARTGLIGARYDVLASLSELRALLGLENEESLMDALP